MYRLILFALCVIIVNSFKYHYHLSSSSSSLRRYRNDVANSKYITMAMTMSPPTTPKVVNVDKTNNVAQLSVTVSGEATQKAFDTACNGFNEEVKKRGLKIQGFRPGAKLPPLYLYQIFGEDQVKNFCGTLLASDIQDECEKTGMMFVGRGRITNFFGKDFTPGKPHTIDLECDLWPEIKYNGPDGYKGISVTVAKDQSVDDTKKEAVKKSIRERYKIISPKPAEYVAALGDIAVVNMNGFEKNSDGTKGSPLPSVAKGDNIEVPLEKGKFMEGLVENIVGSRAGDKKSVNVKFPAKLGGASAGLGGKEAIFDVEVLEVKSAQVPEWNEELAARIRDGMTLADLEAQVSSAVEGDMNKSVETARNDAIANVLVGITEISKLPESLMEENTQQKFQQMLFDFKEQGATQEQIDEMATPDGYKRYREVSKKNVEKVVKLGMIFRDIAEKEKIVVTETEIVEQLDMIKVQAKQKNEPMPDEARARDEIENVLLRNKVFDFIASTAKITWTDLPKDQQK